MAVTETMTCVYRCMSCGVYVRQRTPALPSLDARAWHTCREDVRGVAVLEQVLARALEPDRADLVTGTEPPAVARSAYEGTHVDSEAFARFIGDLHARLEAGARAYGDASFERSPSELLDELRQEALDLAGWGFVLATRIERLQQRVERDRAESARFSMPGRGEGTP